MNALILYDEFSQLREANRILRSAMQNANGCACWDITPWHVNVLRFPQAADHALAEAAHADLIFFAALRPDSLVPWLEEWLQQWASRRQVNDAALVAMNYPPAPSASWLAPFAEQHGLTLITNANANETAKACKYSKPTVANEIEINSPSPGAIRLPALILSAALVVFMMAASGCAHYPVNEQLASPNTNAGYRFENAVVQTNSDDLWLALAFSGGGTRASALSYGVLQELARTQVGNPGNEHRLLDDIKMISSVSGGSFTAAYYTLRGDRIFSDYESRFLKKRIETGLILRLAEPWNWIRLASPRFSTSDLAAEYYDHLLFKGATFGDLAPKPARPFLIVNATDLAIGARFEFTQDQFDLLRSDVSKFPIARAVAASAAFPPYFGPLVLKNYSAENPVPEPELLQSVLSDPNASSRLKNLALQDQSYVDGSRRKFIHLVDGGITDNLGLRAPADRALQLEDSKRMAVSPIKFPRRMAIIIVDANAERDYGWDSKDGTLGRNALMSSVAHAALSRYSFETIELFRELSARLDREREILRVQAGDAQAAKIKSYIVELHFNQLPNDADRRFFNSVPTRLQLPTPTVDRLEKLARRELENNLDFRKLVADLQRNQDK